jgi:hypothetical protein
LSLESLDNFVISPDVPRLDRPADLMILEEVIRKQQAVCVVIDPTYLALGEHKSRNLFAMNLLLQPLRKLCESTGCTVLLVHHSKHSRKVGDPATLDDVAGSGFAEFSAQWLLLARRRPFEPEKSRPELWLTTGSRVGDRGQWALDVDEGSSNEAGTRAWKMTLCPATTVRAEIDARFVAASEDRRLRRRALQFDALCQRTLEFLAAYIEGANATTIREALGINGLRMSRVLDTLVKRGELTTEEIWHPKRKEIVYRRMPMTDLAEAGFKAGGVRRVDEKVYEIRSGQFVVNDGTGDPCATAVSPASRIERPEENPLGANRSDSTPATRSDAEASPLSKSGPDTIKEEVADRNADSNSSDPIWDPDNQPRAWWDRRPRTSEAAAPVESQTAPVADTSPLPKSGPDTLIK